MLQAFEVVQRSDIPPCPYESQENILALHYKRYCSGTNHGGIMCIVTVLCIHVYVLFHLYNIIITCYLDGYISWRSELLLLLLLLLTFWLRLVT